MAAVGAMEAVVILAGQCRMLSNMEETLPIPPCSLMFWASSARASSRLEISRLMNNVRYNPVSSGFPN
jgi:hypothetical protein